MDAQRVERLSNHQIVSPDGELQREYNGWYVLDEYWYQNRPSFRTVLVDIANRRVQMANITEIKEFHSCLASKIDEKRHYVAIEAGLKSLQKELAAIPRIKNKYADIFNWRA